MQTIDDLAERLRVHRSTVSRAIMRKDLVAIRVGRVWRIPVAEFEAALRDGIRSPSSRRR